MKNNIYPCLWFNGDAKAAAEYYCEVFNNSKITSDTPVVVNFEVEGQKIMCLNGGDNFRPNPSISFFIVCETIEETDFIWNRLINGGKALMPLDKYDWSEKYGWLEDKFGISWQISLGKLSDVGQKITALMMFTGENSGKTEEAVKYYTSLFPNSSIKGLARYEPGEPDVEGNIKHAQFKLDNYVLMAMDSSYSHGYNFNEAISIVVECKDQDEIDFYWNNLTKDGEESMCGWLKDRYGVSWQIIPEVLKELMNDKDRAPKVMEAFLKMKKFKINELVEA